MKKEVLLNVAIIMGSLKIIHTAKDVGTRQNVCYARSAEQERPLRRTSGNARLLSLRKNKRAFALPNANERSLEKLGSFGEPLHARVFVGTM